MNINAKLSTKYQLTEFKNTLKGSYTMIKQIYPRDATIHQHMQISQYNIPQQQTKGKKQYMTILLDGEKAFDKVQHLFIIATVQKVGTEERYLKIIKAIYDTSTAKIILNGEG